MIKLQSLTKIYPNGKGIFDLTFEIRKGEVFGYLGPNGAGKTTTIRHLLGFLNSTKGSCTINDLDCRNEQEKIQGFLGYLPGEIAFFNNMTGNDYLDFMSDLRKKENSKKRKELIELFALETNTKIGKMSKGMKQKVGLVTAFMHDPDILILDEPTSGLDPLMQNRFVELINGEKKLNKTILMSSHSFEEINRTCDRVGIINEGKLVAVEDIQQIKANQRKTYIISVSDSQNLKKILNSDFECKKIDENIVKIVVENNYNDFIKLLSSFDITGIDVENQTLEQIFMKYYGKENL